MMEAIIFYQSPALADVACLNKILLITVNYMGGRTTPIVSIIFYFKNHKKLWEWILLHQTVDIGLGKSYAI